MFSSGIPLFAFSGGLTCNNTYNQAAVNASVFSSDGIPSNAFQILQECGAATVGPCFVATLYIVARKADPTTHSGYDAYQLEAVYGPLLLSQVQCFQPITLPLLSAVVFPIRDAKPGNLNYFSPLDTNYTCSAVPPALTFTPA